MGDKKMINPFHEILLILVHILFFFGKTENKSNFCRHLKR